MEVSPRRLEPEAAEDLPETEEITAPTVPLVGIRALRKSRDTGDLAGLHGVTSTVVIHRKKKELTHKTEEERRDEAQLRLQQWYLLRYVLRLQRAYRCRLSKKTTGERLTERKAGFQQLYEASNAEIIQRAWATYKARKLLATLRAEAALRQKAAR
eukprot:TRINITY_DN15015_c0_g1_i1.p1 TRINITY_DN15015_c0_g1~~TRINITY_DN15015_c0_g1_i1.p1  ORF type:complete len:156 (+),score=46.55 TRINITY_DN15015_c0_g1_i1:190-657(+)